MSIAKRDDGFDRTNTGSVASICSYRYMNSIIGVIDDGAAVVCEPGSSALRLISHAEPILNLVDAVNGVLSAFGRPALARILCYVPPLLLMVSSNCLPLASLPDRLPGRISAWMGVQY